MRLAIMNLFFLCGSFCKGQEIDSAWMEKNIVSKFEKDPKALLRSVELIDERGVKISLSNYKGKTIYIDVWSTTCAPCIGQFPYQEQLLKRLKAMQLDTAVILVNINIEDSPGEWKKALKRYQPVGINLHCMDSTLYDDWAIDALPGHILLNGSGNVLARNIMGPGEAGIDWLLYAVAKGINPTEAVWRQYHQNKLMAKHRSTSMFTDEEYAKWFNRIMPSLIEFDSWRKKHKTGGTD